MSLRWYTAVIDSERPIVFVAVPEKKERKNRLHLDLAPHSSQDRDAAIASRRRGRLDAAPGSTKLSLDTANSVGL